MGSMVSCSVPIRYPPFRHPYLTHFRRHSGTASLRSNKPITFGNTSCILVTNITTAEVVEHNSGVPYLYSAPSNHQQYFGTPSVSNGILQSLD